MKTKMIILLLMFSSSIYAKKGKIKPRYLLGHSFFAEYNSTSSNTNLIFLGYGKTDSAGKRLELALGLPLNMHFYYGTEKINFSSGFDFGYNFKPIKIGKRSTLSLRAKSGLVYKKTEMLSGNYLLNDSLHKYDYAKVSKFGWGIMPTVVLTKNISDQFYIDFLLGYQYNIEHIKHSDVYIWYQRSSYIGSDKKQYPLYKGWTKSNGLYLGLKLIYNLSQSDQLCK